MSSPSSSSHSSESWELSGTQSERQIQHLLQAHKDGASQPVSARTRTRTKSSALSDSLAQPSQPFHSPQPAQPQQSPQLPCRGRPKRKTMSLNTGEVFPGLGVNPTQPPASQPQIPIDARPVPLRAPQAEQSQIPPPTAALQLQSRGPRLNPAEARSSPRGSGSTLSDSRHSHGQSKHPPRHSKHSSRERGASSRERGASSRKRDADREQEHPARSDKAQKTLFTPVPSVSQSPSASEGTPLRHANRAGAGQASGGAESVQQDTAIGSAQLHRELGAFQPGGGLVTVQPSGGRAAQASGEVETAQTTGGLANVQPVRVFSVAQSGRGIAAAQPGRRSENSQPGGRFGAAQHSRGAGAGAIQSHPDFEAFASPSEGLIYVQSGAGRGIPPPRPPPGSPPPFRGGPGNIRSGRRFGHPQHQIVQPVRGFGVSPSPPPPESRLSEAGTRGSPSHCAGIAEDSPSGRRSGANQVSGMLENFSARTQSGAGPIPGLEPFQTAGERSQAVPDSNRQVARLQPATGEVSTSRPAIRTASPSPNMTPGAATSQPAPSGASPSQNTTGGAATPQPGTGGASPCLRTGRSPATPQNPPGGTAPSQPASEGALPSQMVARGAAIPQQNTGAASKSRAATDAALTNAEIAAIIEGYLNKMDKFLESAMPTPEALQQCRCLRQAVRDVRECRARLERKHEQNLGREARRIEKELEMDDVEKRRQAALDEENDANRKAEEARARREATAAEAMRLERERNAIGDSSSREGTPEAGPPGT